VFGSNFYTEEASLHTDFQTSGVETCFEKGRTIAQQEGHAFIIMLMLRECYRTEADAVRDGNAPVAAKRPMASKDAEEATSISLAKAIAGCRWQAHRHPVTHAKEQKEKK